LEIEISFKQGIDPRGANVLRWLGDDVFNDLVYAKGDSSVHNGIEVVTHPINPMWAMENFPFDHFQTLIDDHGALKTHHSCGTHIHINREAFSKPHYWKFMQVHLQLPEFCGIVGGRGASPGYGNLLADQQAQREQLMDLTYTKDGSQPGFGRNGVNINPPTTIELRYPRGGTRPTEIRKNVQWVDALYAFTNYISVADVKDGALSNPGYLLWWINQGQYPDLADWLQEAIPQPVPLTERS
jgi:hypothetical protein